MTYCCSGECFGNLLYHAAILSWPFGVLVVMPVIVVFVRGLRLVGGGWWLLLIDWLVGVELGVCAGVLVCWCVCWGRHVSFEMKRAGDLFPNHSKERTDPVRQ